VLGCPKRRAAGDFKFSSIWKTRLPRLEDGREDD
jgi:hypothetical protein